MEGVKGRENRVEKGKRRKNGGASAFRHEQDITGRYVKRAIQIFVLLFLRSSCDFEFVPPFCHHLETIRRPVVLFSPPRHFRRFVLCCVSFEDRQGSSFLSGDLKKKRNREIAWRKKKKRETNINSRRAGEVVVLAEVKTEKFPNEYRLVVKNGKKEQRDVRAKLNLTAGLEKGGREWKERLLEGKEGQARSGNFSNRRSFSSAVASGTRSRTLNYRISGDLTDFLNPLWYFAR